MTTLSAHTSRAIHNKGMQAVYGIAAEYDVPVEDVIALLGTTSHTSISSAHSPFTRLESTTLSDIGMTISTPSQPEGSSYPHAPAADAPATQAAGVTTDGGVSTSSLASPSVENSVAGNPVTLIPEAPKPLPDDQEMRRPAEAKTSEQEASTDASGGVQDRCESTPPPPSKRQTKRQQVIDCHKANPDWNSFQIAEHLGFGAAHVQVIAGQCGIKLPRAPRAAPENMRDRVLAVIAAQPELTLRQVAAEAGCSLGTASKWAKEALAKPTEAEAPSSEPQDPTEPKLPPLSKPSDRLPLPPPVVRPVRREPSGRFYLREKAVIGQPPRWVHQSLSACPTGPGPLMTLDRKWAWFDTMDRYRGALKQWPQITSMLKEAASK